MRLVRTWPLKPPDDHPRIYDNCERVYIRTVDYSPLSQLNDSVLHLDWDVAVCQHELRTFADRCAAEPERVRVVPTQSYSTRQRRWQKTTTTEGGWMVWNVLDDDSRRRVKPGEPTAHLFSFGMVYLPRWAIAGFAHDVREHRDQWGYDAQFRDVNFGYWHMHVTDSGAPLEWDIHPVHVNYSIKDTFNI